MKKYPVISQRWYIDKLTTNEFVVVFVRPTFAYIVNGECFYSERFPWQYSHHDAISVMLKNDDSWEYCGSGETMLQLTKDRCRLPTDDEMEKMRKATAGLDI